MSRWPTDVLRRLGFGRRPRSRAVCLVGRRAITIARNSGESLALALEAGGVPDELATRVAAALAEHDGGERWSVLLDANVAPLIEMESPAVALDEPAWQALAEHRFAHVLAEPLDRYRIQVEGLQRPGRLACAFPSALIATLLAGSIHRERRLQVVPALVHACSLWPEAPAGPHWLACITPETCQVAFRIGQRVRLGGPAPAGAAASLSEHVAREAAVLGIDLLPDAGGRAVLLGGGAAPPIAELRGDTGALDAFGAKH